MNLNDFLVLLGGVGAVAAISWIFEYFQLFQNTDPKAKQLIFFVACIIVGVGAQLIVQFVPAAMLATIAPYFATIATIFSYLFLGTKFHQATKVDQSVDVNSTNIKP
jgi:hypothetical protein